MSEKYHKPSVVQTQLLSVFRLMKIQTALVVVISLGWGFSSFQGMISAFLGGAVSIIPNLYFARRFFSSGRSEDSQNIVRAFYKGELFKFLIMVGLILLIFTCVPILIFPFLTGFVVATLGLWCAPLLFSWQSKARAKTA